MYLSINTRPDLSYSVGVLARHCINPSFKACQAVLGVLTLLRSTPDVDIRIEFQNNELGLYAFSDADCARDHDSRGSVTGYVVFVAGGTIAWQNV